MRLCTFCLGVAIVRNGILLGILPSATFVSAKAARGGLDESKGRESSHDAPKQETSSRARRGGSSRKLVHHTDYINDECSSFCKTFVDTCHNEIYYLPYEPGYDGCMEACVQYPRTKLKIPPEGALPPPGTPGFQGGAVYVSAAIAEDSFACRQNHLALASPLRAANAGSAGQGFHCYHASPEGGAICTNPIINGKTPFAHMRDGMDTWRRYGYCDLLGDDTIADCTLEPINDDLLPTVLQMLPGTVEYLFMQEVPGITYLDFTTFANLQNPENLKALYLDGCSISRVDARVFEPVKNLQILSLTDNQLESIPRGTLWCLTQLRHFSGTGNRFNSDYFDSDMFRDKPLLENLNMFGLTDVTELPAGFADGLTNHKIFSFVSGGLTNEGIPDGLFDDLVSVEYFDFFGSRFTSLPKNWFGEWSHNIKRLSFDGNLLMEVEWELFQDLPSVEQVWLHQNERITSFPDGTLDNNPNLLHISLGGAAVAEYVA